MLYFGLGEDYVRELSAQDLGGGQKGLFGRGARIFVLLLFNRLGEHIITIQLLLVNLLNISCKPRTTLDKFVIGEQ